MILNSLYSEPYQRVQKFLSASLGGGESDAFKQLEVLDSLDFAKFMQLKKNWFKNFAKVQWLI